MSLSPSATTATACRRSATTSATTTPTVAGFSSSTRSPASGGSSRRATAERSYGSASPDLPRQAGTPAQPGSARAQSPSESLREDRRRLVDLLRRDPDRPVRAPVRICAVVVGGPLRPHVATMGRSRNDQRRRATDGLVITGYLE